MQTVAAVAPCAATGHRGTGWQMKAFQQGSFPDHALDTILIDHPEDAAQLVRQGRLVAFPTETVYGLGADAFNVRAVEAVFEAKGRPPDNPLIVHIADSDQLKEISAYHSDAARILMDHFFPGPLTVIVRKSPALAPAVTARLETVAIRMPSLSLAHRFLSACGRPVAAPSANRSGRPSATTWKAVQDDLDGRIAAILRGPPAARGIESTVVDCTQGMPMLLRPGVVSLEQLRAVVPIRDTTMVQGPATRRSPGMRYRHYAPNARVVLVGTPDEAVPDRTHAYIGVSRIPNPSAFGRCCHAADEQGYARTLFDFFRQCDAIGIRTIFCQTTSMTGIGHALMDRLRRAAAT